MRTFIISLFLLVSLSSYSQVKQEGNILSSSKVTVVYEPVKTDLYWKDNKGMKYPIYMSGKSNTPYIIKVSKKTGKEYKQYLSKEVKEMVLKQYPFLKKRE